MSPVNGPVTEQPPDYVRGPLVLGPVWDHTLCAVVNDLGVCDRLARHYIGRRLAVTCGNALTHYSGGQVVAGSNPVSPTDVSPTEKIGSDLRRRDSDPTK